MTLDVSSAMMDLTSTAINNNNNTTSGTKSPQQQQQQHDPEIHSRIQPVTVKPLSFSNGVLKRHPPKNPPAAAISYKECLKNHAASLGGHALDGCGEFMPSPSSNSSDPTSLKCAACGCHRNFHRRDPDEPIPTATATHVIEYQPHHRHHPPPPLPPNRSPNSASPPPISSSYYPSAPHMLLALSAGLSPHPAAPPGENSRKRFRTKFTQEQKDRMYEFAERVGWKMQKRDDELVREFCHDVGVDRSVLKVWMHNNKNTLGKKLDGVMMNGNSINNNGRELHANHPHDHVIAGGNNNNNNNGSAQDPNHHHYQNDGGPNAGTNGSSSSS